MWETIEIVGISRTASLVVRQDCSGFKSAKTADLRRKAPVGWFSVGSHVSLSLIPGACHMGHSWQWYGEESSSLLQGISRLSIELLKCCCKIGAFPMLPGKIAGRFRAQAVS